MEKFKSRIELYLESMVGVARRWPSPTSIPSQRLNNIDLFIFITFEIYWKELFKSIVILEIVQNVIVMCYNTHFISSNPRIQFVIQLKTLITNLTTNLLLDNLGVKVTWIGQRSMRCGQLITCIEKKINDGRDV